MAVLRIDTVTPIGPLCGPPNGEEPCTRARLWEREAPTKGGWKGDLWPYANFRTPARAGLVSTSSSAWSFADSSINKNERLLCKYCISHILPGHKFTRSVPAYTKTLINNVETKYVFPLFIATYYVYKVQRVIHRFRWVEKFPRPIKIRGFSGTLVATNWLIDYMGMNSFGSGGSWKVH